MIQLFKRVPRTLFGGHMRTTTALLVVLWMGLFVLYGWADERYQDSEPAAPQPVPAVGTTVPPTTTEPPSTTETTTTTPSTTPSTTTPDTSTTDPAQPTTGGAPTNREGDAERRQPPTTTNTPTESTGGYTGFP